MGLYAGFAGSAMPQIPDQQTRSCPVYKVHVYLYTDVTKSGHSSRYDEKLDITGAGAYEAVDDDVTVI